MRWIVLVLLISTIGCAGTREITDLREILPHDSAQPHHTSVAAVLSHYFTAKAHKVIKDIPLIDGPTISGYAAGTTVLSNFATLITLNGWGRKVIISADHLTEIWGINAIVHEYVHHLDDMDRDGDAEFIDHGAFKDAYARMSRDFNYAGIFIMVERQLRDYPFYYDLISIGEFAERIAYTAGFMATTGKGPDYMKVVLGKMLRFAPVPQGAH